ncbi:ankyrin repeat domain-containing protein SOWAHC isoform X2 [Lucilia cuprina]|uniref:ankyrin repeat domain-containing protein SOWAHC isoform X2 n=1 Tax=Lucilia cuprina TaxID=7375 RepID=UPI001F050BED|nr:ankyrin repeat domain-containing protein SOWAHC isoform X2 [Lucilia cuprina]
MEGPKELSLSEIRKYMLDNGCKVTNHALVKHFKRFLTHPETQNEARKEFKTYVNILATIKNENNQKYLILRKKYLNECPSEDVVQRAVSQAGDSDSVPSSPGGVSLTSDAVASSPYRQPPPYKPPPEVSSPLTKVSQTPVATGVAVHTENVENYRDCVNEFTTAMSRIDPKRLERQSSENEPPTPTPQGEDNKRKELEEKANREKSVSRANSVDESGGNKENIPRFSFSSGSSATSTDGSGEKSSGPDVDTENPISVKEATRKFNRMASEEEAKIISPPSKKKPEKLIEEKELPEVTLAHPKAKEWIVSMAKANYQELAKLANEYPELVKLHDPATGTALHWAAKQGNEDVVKLIAGTYKADVNAQTNGGYTPLHIAMQFGRSNIFALLCNTYKANRDLLDWAGNKPLDYSKQQTSVSASTYSKIQAMRQQLISSGYGTWRNQSKEKTYSRKRFGIPTDWLFECASEENDRSIQQLLGSGQWHDTLTPPTTTTSPSTRSLNSKSPSPAPSPSPSLSSSSLRSRWYDAESAPSSSDDDEKISNNDNEEPTIIVEPSSSSPDTGLKSQCTN